MSEFDLDVLSVIGEAVLIARGEKIVFANSPAVAILGGKCIGKRVSTLLGTEISGMQAKTASYAQQKEIGSRYWSSSN